MRMAAARVFDRSDVIDVPVIRPFTHEGRAFHVGDTISVLPITAAVLHQRGLVSLVKGYQTRALSPETPAKRTRKRKDDDELYTPRRTYRRRDLVPEP